MESPEYVHLLVHRTAEIVVHYAVEAAMPFHLSVIFPNLRKLIMAYRIVRPNAPQNDV